MPIVASAIAAALAFALFVYVRNDIERDALLRFERQSADAKHIIEKRLRSYVEVSYGLRALFGARDSLSRAEFHRYVESLNVRDNYPGFVQLNYARHIQGGEKQRLEEEVRRDKSLDPRGYPKFAVRPPGERPEHHVLIYIEPMQGNEFSFGLAIGVSGPQAKAMAHIRDSGELTSSGRLVLAGAEGYVGLAMRIAVYRKGMPIDTVEQRRAAYIGTVGAGYNVHKLMAGVLDQTTMTFLRYRLFDAGPVGAKGAEAAKPVLLFDSAQSARGAPREDLAVPGDDPRFRALLPLELAGRTWELHFAAPKAAFMQRSDHVLPWLVLAGGLLCSALLFAVLYAFSSSRERAMSLADEMTRGLRASEVEIRELLRRLVSVQETERRRFSAHLHDLVGQSLTVLGIGLQTIRGMLPGAPSTRADAAFTEMGQVLKDTMGSVRQVMSDLRPPLLDDYGLYAAIEWHARQFAARTGVRVAVGGGTLEPRPSPEVEMALFRIAQEALVNVAKHANAREARVEVSAVAGQVRLLVEDDGRGIARGEAANDPHATGLGMAVMRERAAAVGGAMKVESAGQGTRIVVEVAAGDPHRPG